MTSLILVRGLPGSGKSTFAKKLSGFIHVEADMYFINEDGEYIFNMDERPNAHAWCQSMARTLLRNGHNVVVSNTFSRKWEMEPYFEMCGDVSVVMMTTQFQNVHGVPQDIVDAMRDRWEF